MEINVKYNKIHLCNSCQLQLPTCPSRSHEVLYGDGKGNDNIVCCPNYKPIKIKDDIK